MRLRDLQAAASVSVILMGSVTQPGLAQVQKQTIKAPAGDAVAAGQQDLPTAPTPKQTEPLYMRDTPNDYTQPRHQSLLHPLNAYKPEDFPLPRLSNTPRLGDLLRDGTLYLSLSDAVTLSLENNFDIAIARINLDIADTDVLRTRAGGTFRGVSTGLVTGTLGGTTTTITGGGGPGGTTSASGGSGTGSSGLVLSENGNGPAPELLDPALTGTVGYESSKTVQSTTFITGTSTLNQNTSTYNVGYQQGFQTGTLLNVTFNNSRVTTNSERSSYSPLLQTNFRAQATQHLLQGFGTWINGRFMIQAKNNRRITDSAFRQQIIYTVTQVESIYWALVSAYEDVQAKERALDQSTKLTADNRRQLEIGTLAPLDVVNSDSAVATDKQALIASKSNLQYQQLLMKQAIARNLDDKIIAAAPVIPTDRVGLDRLAEEDMTVEDLVQQAYVNNPQIEQAVLTMKNNEITIRALKNGLLPTVDAVAFYASSGLGGSQSALLNCGTTTGPFVACPPGTVPNSNYGGVFQNTFNNSSPDYGASVNINIPLRNRIAQADQARSQMEYRQTQMRLQQLYTQIRIQVINGQYALTNDRAQVVAAQSTRDFNAQSLDAEQKKYKLGASTTANVLQQERNLAAAENNLISATAAYARDRSNLRQILSNTLDEYGIDLVDTAKGEVNKNPSIPGLTAPKPPAAPKPISVTPDTAAPGVPATTAPAPR
ncbi:TolC family protein [Granulicella sibirica]|uniref:TolC family protein n=1 Tax=Granulicella sibirica TaxID=2479048 RepID=UPI0026B7680B